MTSPRKDIIERAARFLRDPRSKAAPLEKRIEFLKSKECTQEEIDQAIAMADKLDAEEAAKKAKESLVRGQVGEFYAKTVRIPGLLFSSGIIATDSSKSFEEQVKQVFDSVEQLLKENGSSKESIITSNVVLANMDDASKFNEKWKEWLDKASLPARTLFSGQPPSGSQLEVAIVAKTAD